MARELEQAFQTHISNALKATLAYAKSTWTSIAQQELKSSREDYISGISAVIMEDPLSGYITLKGKFPVMLEQGFNQFDIKSGFEKSPKAKSKPDGGWYLTVPYRHYTTSTFNPTMPKDIMKQAKNLNPGEQLSEALVSALGYKRGTSHTGYQWKNTMYDNLTRITKEYDSGKIHSQYITFRRVSDNSDPNSWIHPGYKGLKALDKVAPMTEKFFYDYMKG